MKNQKPKYKAHYNPDRECYISADGKYLCYRTIDLDTRRPVTLYYEIGKGVLTEELTFQIDEMNYAMDLNDRHQGELRDSLFDAKVASHAADCSDEDTENPWETILDRRISPEEMLFAEEEPENPRVAEVRRVIDEECTEAEQDLFFAHFGEGMQLEEIRQLEVAQTGKIPTAQAMLNRKNKIFDKVAQALGVGRVKRRSYPKKD